jgi:Ca2+-binding EF-hand superfamily protein
MNNNNKSGNNYRSATESSVSMTSPYSSCLTRTELQALRDAFTLFDTEASGRIRISELKSVLRDLSNENNNPENTDDETSRPSRNLEALLSTLDAMTLSPPNDNNNNNHKDAEENDFLTMDDFIRLMTEPHFIDPNDSRDELEKVFDLFDEDRKGYISLKDLRKAATDLGESMTDEELNEMISRASSDGKVTLAQFRDIMNKKLFA